MHLLETVTLVQNSLSSSAGSNFVSLGRIIGPFFMTFIGNMVFPLGLTWAYHISPFQKLYPILASRESVIKFLTRLTMIAVIISVVALITTANGKFVQNPHPTEL